MGRMTILPASTFQSLGKSFHETRRLFPATGGTTRVSTTGKGMNASSLNLIEELKLRRWARLNYLPPGERSADLHPVVLNEMQHRDAEDGRDFRDNVDGTAIVPLNPVGTHQPHRLEGPHVLEPQFRDSGSIAPLEMYYS